MTRVTISKAGREIHLGTLEHHIFTKRVKESAHLYKKLDAWGFDAKSMHELVMPHAKYIVIDDIETGITYKTRISILKQFGKYLSFPEHGTQLFLARVYFRQFKGEKMIADYARSAAAIAARERGDAVASDDDTSATTAANAPSSRKLKKDDCISSLRLYAASTHGRWPPTTSV